MAAECDDGWGDEFDDVMYVNAYEQLETEICRSIDKVLEKSSTEEFRPKYKHQMKNRKKKQSADDEWRDAIYNTPEIEDSQSESEDRESQKLFFRPPLQVQRNMFVRNTLFDFKSETKRDFTKMCIMGCGEMSLERFLLESLAMFGVKMLLSVDFDEKSLSIGQQLLETRMKEQEEVLSNQPGFPILLRSFSGNILDLDFRFANADCIISLEVIEHMPLEEARQFISQVLGNFRPRIFIFSTPNNDYNQAFGDPPGAFRHDDHKFEMGIDEFGRWKEELAQEFGYAYDIEGPVYIGKFGDGKFDHLKGATQAMICRLRQNLKAEVLRDSIIYQSVSQSMCPIGARPVICRLLKKAFIEFVESFSFCPMALTRSGCFQYWSVDIKRILHHIHAPISFVAHISDIQALKMIEKLSRHHLSTDITDQTHSVLIPNYMKKDELIGILRNSC